MERFDCIPMHKALLAFFSLWLCTSSFAAINADLFLDFEAGTIDGMITPALLASGGHPGTQVWHCYKDNVQGETFGSIYVGSGNRTVSVTAGGVTYSGAGTRCLKYDMGTGPTHWECAQTFLPASTYNVIICGYFYAGVHPVDPNSWKYADLITINDSGGTIFAVMQQIWRNSAGLNQLRTHAKKSGSSVYGDGIVISPDTWYWFCFERDAVAGYARLNLYNATTSALIGSSVCEMDTGTDSYQVLLGDHFNDTSAGDFNLWDSVSVIYTSPSFPVLPSSYPTASRWLPFLYRTQP